jgi:hypothetical protein
MASRKLQGDDISMLLVFWQNWVKSTGTGGSSVRLTKNVPVPGVPVAAGAAIAKFTGLLCTPPTVTTTFPEVVHGTGATIFVVLQLDGVDETPLNVTALPGGPAKLLPSMVTEVPT